MINPTFIAQVVLHEGFRDRPYRDTVGKLTIGYGWNIDDTPMEREAAEVQLTKKLEKCEAECTKAIDFFTNLTQARREVLVEMCFNLGLQGLLGFKNTLRLMESSKHEAAAEQMLLSKWATQVGKRAKDLSEKYRRG